MRRIAAALVVAALALLVFVAARAQLAGGGITLPFGSSASELIQRDAYQAVFLANGSSYFGKLQQRGEWFLLTDVFYLSVSDDGTQIIKRGAEPQGPKEPMVIPASNVLFFENLRDDSEIVTAMRRYASGQPVTQPRATLPPASTPRPSPTATTR